MKKTILLLCLAIVLFIAIAMQNQASTTNATASIQSAQSISATVPHQLVRINQLDPAQYDSPAEYATWAYSTCSTAALVEVMNYYGHHFRIHDVLTGQARIGAITPALGLTDNAGIANTAAQFGFQTSWGYGLSLDQIIQHATGTPVIVGWPPQRYPGGHLVVVESGTRSTISIADSSQFNRHILSHAQFLQWWGGFSAIVTPAQGGQL